MLKIGFIGAGKMAQALAKGFLAAGLTKGERIIASDPFPTSVQEFQRLGGRAVTDNCDVVKCSEVLFIAVKPAVVPAVLAQVNPFITTNHLVISIAMGVSIADIEKGLPPATRVIRMMPNTPVLVRSGASVFVCGSAINSEDEAIAIRLLESVGLCYKVPESLINPITALSGSGPAYIYVVIEALADGAVKMGMPRDLAYRLAAQTVIGAGNMVLSTNIHPGQLKDDVASPADEHHSRTIAEPYKSDFYTYMSAPYVGGPYLIPSFTWGPFIPAHMKGLATQNPAFKNTPLQKIQETGTAPWLRECEPADTVDMESSSIKFSFSTVGENGTEPGIQYVRAPRPQQVT